MDAATVFLRDYAAALATSIQKVYGTFCPGKISPKVPFLEATNPLIVAILG